MTDEQTPPSSPTSPFPSPQGPPPPQLPGPLASLPRRKTKVYTGWNCCECYTNNDDRHHPSNCHRVHCGHARCSACIDYRTVFN